MSDNFKYSEQQISDLLEGIYSGEITKYDIPESLYFAIVDYLKSGVYKGFGGGLTDFTGKDLELLKELRENIYLFSGGKAYHQIDDISSLLLDDEGERISLREFSKLGAMRFDEWNDSWGRSEYNTAVASAQSAVKWNEIEKNKDLLPVLTYVTIGDACDICAPLDGFTAKVDDPIWDEIYAPNHFNCLCHVEQNEDDLELTEDPENITDKVLQEMDDTFKINSGKTGYVFGEDHPYFQVPKEDLEFAKNNFGLPIPEGD